MNPLTPTQAQGLADLNQAAESVWLACSDQWPTLNIEVLPEVGSTNTRALQIGRDSSLDAAPGPCVVVAWRQTAGRGRAGRPWQAQPGQTLTFSLALPLDLQNVPGGGSALSLAVGLSVAKSLDQIRPHPHKHPPTPIGLKWPNDLWVQGRKLGGILIEAALLPALLMHPAPQRWVVIGIGLNLQLALGAPPDRTSLAEHGLMLSPGQAMQTLVPALLQACQAFEAKGFAPMAAAYAQRDVLSGCMVNLWRHQAPATEWAFGALAPNVAPPPDGHGQALGVLQDGALRVQPMNERGEPEGKPLLWRMGEVSVRPATP